MLVATEDPGDDTSAPIGREVVEADCRGIRALSDIGQRVEQTPLRPTMVYDGLTAQHEASVRVEADPTNVTALRHHSHGARRRDGVDHAALQVARQTACRQRRRPGPRALRTPTPAPRSPSRALGAFSAVST